MEIKQMLLDPNKYSRPQTELQKVTKIAIHYVGNTNSTATANRNYFNNLQYQNRIYASSHYIIGLQGEIIQCVPTNEIAYCTNSANSYSLSIECCHKENGIFTLETRKSLVELTASLLKKYNLNENDIIRHYDVTKKSCPLCWSSNTGEKYKDYLKFKEEVKKELNATPIQKLNIMLNGVKKQVDCINVDGSNYIKIRDLEDKHIKIGYCNATKVVTVTTS